MERIIEQLFGADVGNIILKMLHKDLLDECMKDIMACRDFAIDGYNYVTGGNATNMTLRIRDIWGCTINCERERIRTGKWDVVHSNRKYRRALKRRSKHLKH